MTHPNANDPTKPFNAFKCILFAAIFALGAMGCDEDSEDIQEVQQNFSTYCEKLFRIPQICPNMAINLTDDECFDLSSNILNDVKSDYPRCMDHLNEFAECLADSVSFIHDKHQCDQVINCTSEENELLHCISHYDDFPPHPIHESDDGHDDDHASPFGATLEDLIQQSIEHCIANGHMMTICMSEFYQEVDESHCSRSFYNESDVDETAGGAKCYSIYSNYLTCMTQQTKTLTSKAMCDGPEGYPGGYERPCRDLATAWYNCKEGTNF